MLLAQSLIESFTLNHHQPAAAPSFFCFGFTCPFGRQVNGSFVGWCKRARALQQLALL